MPDLSQLSPHSLALRAAEVRRLSAQREAEHSALILALSMRCPEDDVARDELCYPPPARRQLARHAGDLSNSVPAHPGRGRIVDCQIDRQCGGGPSDP